MLAALCWQRLQEITDNLVELLIHIAHRVGVRAEAKVELELMKYATKVLGKARLLYQLAKAAKGQPRRGQGSHLPRGRRGNLEDIIHEAEAAENYERRVKWMTRASYSHHYRRIVPELLELLSFGCNNDIHRPVTDALALLKKYRDRKTTVFPASEKVPLDGVVGDHWRELVQDYQNGGAINRISYEWCVLTRLREKVRCKEVWVKGAHRFRNPTRTRLKTSTRGVTNTTPPSNNLVTQACLWRTCAAKWRPRSPLWTSVCQPMSKSTSSPRKTARAGFA
jgi:hypothetical protein